MEKELKQLKEEKSKLQRRINDLEHKKLVETSIPRLKKSIGKCFKYHNSYGSNIPRWFLYLKIVSVDEKNMNFETVQFQRTSLDHIEIRFNTIWNYNGEDYFNDSSYIEIKPSEYNRAKKGVIKTIDRIINQ